MRLTLPLLLATVLGCESSPSHRSHDPKFLVPVETLRTELRNSNYQWNGPTSIEDRIPMLHAARALAYRGDSAAPVLFDAVDDPNVDVYSVMDAISELGIPAHEYHDEIIARRSRGLRDWWTHNQLSTLRQRNKHRYEIGLPSATIGN